MTPLLGIKAYLLTLLCCTVIILWIPGSGSPAPFSRMKMDKVDSNVMLNASIDRTARQLGQTLTVAESKIDTIKQQHKEIRKQTKELKETIKQLIQQPNDFYYQMGDSNSVPRTIVSSALISALEEWQLLLSADSSGVSALSDNKPTR